MKKKSIRRLLPCASYDVERIEGWLTDMAAKGWYLKECGTLFLFEEGQPGEIRYRLEPRLWRNNDPDVSFEDFCQECGWEYVSQTRDFFVYRTADPNAREMNTDPDIHAFAVRRLMSQYCMTDGLKLLIWLFCFRKYILRPYTMMVTFGLAVVICVAVVILFLIVSFAVHLSQLIRLHKKLKAGLELNRSKPGQKTAWFYRMMRIVFSGVLVLLVTMGSYDFFLGMVNNLSKIPLSEYDGNPPFATIADICPDGVYIQKQFPDYNTYHTHSVAYMPLRVGWMELAKVESREGQVYSGTLFVDYYELSADWIARGLVKEMLREAQSEKKYEEIILPELGADLAVAYYAIGSPEIILQYGNVVVNASVGVECGEENVLVLWTEKMMEKLK